MPFDGMTDAEVRDAMAFKQGSVGATADMVNINACIHKRFAVLTLMTAIAVYQGSFRTEHMRCAP